MAILGGGVGGAGNPVGGSYTGPAQTLEYSNRFVYAYSGPFDMTQSAQTYLSFTTGNNTTDMLFQCNGAICTASNSCVGGGGTTGFDIKFNGTVVAKMKTDTSQEDTPTTTYQKLIIPPYTEVIVSGISDAADSSYQTTVCIRGRVYRD